MSKQLWKNDELNEKEREIQDLDCIIYLLNADIKIANDYLEIILGGTSTGVRVLASAVVTNPTRPTSASVHLTVGKI